MSEDNPFDRVVGRWEDVVGDMEATATEYREAGWEVLELHPGDVTVLDGERHGLDVLVPGEEYERLVEIAEGATFEDYELYRADNAGVVFALVVLTYPAEEQAVCCPLYYEASKTDELARRASETGTMYTHIRPLAGDQVVRFAYQEPGRFFTD